MLWEWVTPQWSVKWQGLTFKWVTQCVFFNEYNLISAYFLDPFSDRWTQGGLKQSVTIFFPETELWSGFAVPAVMNACAAKELRASTRRDQLQPPRHCQRPPPPQLYGYHNDLSGANGRTWDAMIWGPGEPLTAQSGRAHWLSIYTGQSGLSEGLREKYRFLGWCFYLSFAVWKPHVSTVLLIHTFDQSQWTYGWISSGLFATLCWVSWLVQFYILTDAMGKSSDCVVYSILFGQKHKLLP